MNTHDSTTGDATSQPALPAQTENSANPRLTAPVLSRWSNVVVSKDARSSEYNCHGELRPTTVV